MGLFVSRIISSMFSKKTGTTKMLMLGLDGAGKTTILYQMKLNEYLSTVPTIGFNVEELNYKNLRMTIWDIGGQGSIRKLWRHYYEKSEAVIFVVDCSDKERFELAREELHNMMSDPSLFGAKLLVFANKMDIADISVKELTFKLELDKLKVDWHIQGAIAMNGEGLYDGFDWLSKAMKSKK